jgi:hypothetical protein
VQPPDANDRTAELYRRLGTDPEFRRAYRADPAAACRKYGFEDLAQELPVELPDGPKAFHTLECRESRSGLSSAAAAAAVETLGTADLQSQAGSAGQVADPPPEVSTPETPPVEPSPTPPASETPTPPVTDTPSEATPGTTVPPASTPGGPPPGDTPTPGDSGHPAPDPPSGAPIPTSPSPGTSTPVGSTPGPVSPATGPAAGDTPAPTAPTDPVARPGDQPLPTPTDDDPLVRPQAPLQPTPPLPESAEPVPLPGYDEPLTAPDAPADDPPAETMRATGVMTSVPDSGHPDVARATMPFAAVEAPQPELLSDLSAPLSAAALDALADASAQYPGDEAPREEIAVWMARQAHNAGVPAELPVMAALVESGLQNLTYGDRDSLGFFQMRASIWDSGDYAGYSESPALQLKWFLDHAVAVKQARLARGENAFLHDSAAWGEWIADIERPAEEYRGRYQLQLAEARGLLAAGLRPEGDLGDLTDLDELTDVQAGPAALEALAIARRYVGTPYRWGGESPETGFDCSGLAYYAYGQLGVELPRVAEDQFRVGEAIARDALEPGDLVFFADRTGYIHHEGISIGGSRFLHAPHTGDVVKISSLDEPYYAQQFAGGRRLVPLAASPPPIDGDQTPPAGDSGREAADSEKAADGVEKESPPPEPAVAHARATGVTAAVPGSADVPARGTAGAIPVVESASARPDEDAAALVDVSPAYPGDGAPKDAIARWMAAEATKAGLPAELPVMASLVESGLQNVGTGEGDALGYFQMRSSVWNRDEHAGFVEDPTLQLKWFIREAVILREKRIAAGDAGFGQDPGTWGEWVADVQRPDQEDRGRYQFVLEEAKRLLRLA